MAKEPVYVRALVIGAGFSGLGMGRMLKQRQIPFLILEQADSLGGTWYFNKYPGAACDIPSWMYCFSFALSALWGHIWADQKEILAYMRDVAARYEVEPSIKFGRHVESAYWDETESLWHVTVKCGD